MTNPRFLETLFNQISSILLTIQNKECIPLTEEDKKTFDTELDQIEQQLDFFQKVTKLASERSGIDEQAVHQIVNHPDNTLKQEDRKVLEKAKRLKEDLEGLKRQVETQVADIKIRKRKEKTEGKKRKSKFKKFGGQGWMRL